MTPLFHWKGILCPLKFRTASAPLKKAFLSLFMLLASVVVMANNYVVSSGANAGAGTLRQAITDANAAGAGPHSITFTVAGIITITSSLPALTAPGVTIDGGGTVTISGPSANDNSVALIVLGTGANNTIIKGLTLRNTGTQPINISGALSGVMLEDLWLRQTGTDYMNHGIYVGAASTNMTIKNVTITDVQMGAWWGIRFRNTVTGLTIDGLRINGCGRNYVGTGNDIRGIQFEGAVSNTTIKNSTIDLDAPATTDDGNYGIYFNTTVSGLTLDSVQVRDAEIYNFFIGGAAVNVALDKCIFTNKNGWGGNQQVRFNSTATGIIVTNSLFEADQLNTADDGNHGLVFINNVQTITIQNNTFREQDANGVYLSGLNNDNVLVKGNLFDKTGSGGDTHGGIRFVYMRNTTSDGGQVRMSQNTFRNNNGAGIYLHSGNTSSYIIPNVLIDSNVISGTKTGYGGIRITYVDKIVVSKNSIFNNVGKGIELVANGNCSYEGANTPKLLSSVETSPGSGTYNISVTMPSICGTGGCSLELFSTEAGLAGGVGGQHHVNTFAGLSSGINTLGNVTGPFNEITAAPYGRWTATLSVSANNCGTSEFSNKIAIKVNGPAGVDNGIQLWLTPDFTDPGNMINGLGWEDFSGNNRSFSAVASDPARVDAGLNYNHYINFDGNDYLRPATAFVNSFTAGESISVTKAATTTSAMGAPYDFGGNSNHHYTWNTGAVYNDFGTNDRVGWHPISKAIVDPHPGITIAGNPIDVKRWNIYGARAATGNWGVEFNGGKQTVSTITNTPNFSLAGGREYVGAVYGYVYNGDIAEQVLYNRVLTTTERQRVNTYLGVKYGLTLYHNYIASDGTTTWWNLATNIGYNKGISGIARDYLSVLHQKQSYSISASDVVKIGIGSVLYSANEDNEALVKNDRSAFMWGTDSASTSYTTPYITAYSDNRMARVWKVQKTNWFDTTTIIKVNGGNINRTLLVSADPTFATGVSSYPLNDTGAVILNSSLIPDGSYFTFSNKIVAPGCVTNGIQAWFRADDANATGGLWPDYSGKERNAVQASTASQPISVINGINFNTAFNFDGSNDYLSLESPALGTGNISYSVFSVAMPSSISAGYHYLYVEGNNATGQRVSDGRVDSRLVNANYSNDVVSTSGDLSAGTPYILGYTRSAASSPYIRNLYRNNKLLTTNSSTTALNKTNNYQRIGNSSGSELWNGYIGEAVIYDRALNNVESQQVQSYLALKYGITLDQTTPVDYLASNGSTRMWDATINAAYNKDIAGIGKDNCDKLHQKQSKSVNTGALVTMALGDAIAEDNKANTNEVTNNLSFLAWGDNGGAITYTENISSANATLRMSRIWKADKTNWADQDITIKLNGSARNTYLLISYSDATFITIDQELALGEDSSVTFSSSLLPDGAYFTFAKEILGPGYVNNGVAAWYRADAGLAPSLWEDYSGNGIDLPQSTVANQPGVAANNTNYNPAATFNGSNQYFGVAIAGTTVDAATSVLGTNTTNNIAVFGVSVSKAANRGTLFSQYASNANYVAAAPSYDLTTTFWDAPYGWRASGAWGGTVNIANVWSFTKTPANMYAYRDRKTVGTYAAAMTGINGENYGSNIGVRSGWGWFNGDISEVIVYKDISLLTTGDRLKIESYLAFKYGITLDQTTPTDYLATDSSITWKASDNTGYTSHIAGIGRDDKTALYQKQSRSVTDTLITIASGVEIAPDNASNTATIDDLSFFTWSNNNGATTYSVPVTGLANATTRMPKVWKVDKTATWADQDITIQVVKGGDRYLLVNATDPTFGAGTVEYTLSIATGSVTLNTVNIPDGAYFTLATKISGPGYVNNGVQTWLRADYAATASNWADFSGKQNNTSQTVTAAQPSEVSSGINFNRALSFNNSSAYMDFTNNLSISGTSPFTVVSVSTRKAAGAWDGILSHQTNATGGFLFGFDASNKAALHRTGTGNTMTGTFTYSSLNMPYLVTGTRGGNNFALYKNGGTDGTVTSTHSYNSNAMRLGNRLTSADVAYYGDIAEVVVYNRELTDSELQRVHSYLSLKYGITYNGGTADYLASDGLTKMWTLADNTGYTSRIAGIGRDDSTELHQKQSLSVESGLVTIAIGMVAPSNSENTDTVINNNSFLVIADNNGVATYGAPVTAAPVSTYRMGRIWKVDKTNWADADITLKLNKRPQNVYLLISMDQAFSTVDQELILNAADSTVSLNSSLLPDGAYFTFGSKLYVPGGVAPTALWLRPDMGTSSTTDNSAIDTWADNSPSGNDAVQATAANQPLYMDNATDNINFNPVLKFNGTSQYMDMDVSLLPLGTSARSLFATAKPATVSGGNDYIIGWGSGATSAGMGLANINGTGQLVGFGNDVTSAGFWQLNVPNEMTGVWLGGSGTAATIYSKTLQKATLNKSWNTGSTSGARIGSSPWGAEYWQGTIGDVIVYPAALNAGNRLRINTYLAIKYGYTIDQATATNYLATDSSVIWDATANTAYKYGITGIGRDDVEALTQKQSRNTDTTRLRIVVGLGSLAETNATNTGEFANDKSYLIWGDDNASTTYQTALPGTTLVNYRVARIWKVQETGTVGNVQISVPTTTVPNQEEAFLVVSDDAIFDGTDNLISLSGITLNGVKYLAAEADLTNGQYFTFASNIKLPGGIATPALWLRADKGIDNATDNTAVEAWTDYSNQVNLATQSTVANQPLFLQNATDNINFNPVLKFDGTNDHLENTTAALFSSQNSTLFAAAYQNTYTLWGALLSYNRSGNSGRPGITLTDVNSKIGINRIGVSNVQASVNTPAAPFVMRTLFNTTTVSATANGGGLTNSTGTWGTGSGATQGYYVGRHNSGGNYFNGKIPEVIAYDRMLSASELQQVESYLSIKYGVTLNGGLLNYLATDGSIIWDAAVNSTYTNNIAGIGRDDVEGLTQKQSRSVNSGVQVAIGLGAIASDNLANTNSFLADKNYLVWGDDNGSLTEQTTEVPAYLAGSKRLGREWKAQLTGASPIVQMQLDLSSVSISATSASELYLLVDADGDGDFTTGTVTSLQASDYTAGVVTFDGVSFSTGNVFTIVTQALVVNVNVKAILQGAYNNGTGMMNTTLNSSGILEANAASQPYNTAPFSYAGTESVAPGFFAANPGIVDWVLVELRDESAPSTIKAQRAAFIRNDGNIVDIDGVSPVLFQNVAAGNYHIALRHRNHMSIRTATAQALSATPSSYDFTSAQSKAYQDGSISTNTVMKDLVSGQYAMWAGDGNSNGKVSYSGLNNDYNYLTGALGGNLTSSLNNVYHKADYNLNGKVSASGIANDYVVLTSIVLNGILTVSYLQHQ